MIYDILPVNNYQGNDNATTFDFDFYIENENQLKVYLFDENGTKFELKNNIDYLIEGIQNPNGGYITFPLEDCSYGILTNEQKISLELDLPVSQETQYNNSSLLNLEALEYSFDYLTRLIQILKRKLSLCVKVEECSDNSPQELIDMINDANANVQTGVKQVNEYKNETKNILSQTLLSAQKATESLDKVIAYKNTLIESGMYKFNLFDTKISDHILECEQAKGWVLQGSYVNALEYPDFYQRCLEEKNSATATEATLADGALTMFINQNGHQFYNIADKPIIDAFYSVYGIADFYGIDEVNERVFLPRNKYFHQLTDDVSKVNEMIEAGLPNITGDFSVDLAKFTQSNGSFIASNNQTMGGGYNATSGMIKMELDASNSSSIYGNSNTVQPPSSLKLLYYCVGNTEVTQAITNITEITTSENDTIPLFTGMYFDFKPNNVSWLKAGVQQNSAGIYKTCYETLVEIVNGINNYDLKVINQADMISGVNYDEYWVLDQDNLTFRTPLTIATKSLNGAVVGNGMTLGLTNGTEKFSFVTGNNGLPQDAQELYGKNVGNGTFSTYANTIGGVGVTTDPTKSGIIAEQSTAQLYFKVANAVQNLELLDIGEVLEAVNEINSNALTRNNKEEIVSWGMPDYSAGIHIAWLNESVTIESLPYNFYYQTPSDGFIVLSIYGSNGREPIAINDSFVYWTPGLAGSFFGTVYLPVAKGEKVRCSSGDSRLQSAEFFPLKGAN